MEKDKEFLQVINSFSLLPQVDSIVLGGSRASETHDPYSDYDVYVYTSRPIAVSVRKDILNKACSYTEIDNHYWEPEDDCILLNGICIELIYRTIEQTRQALTKNLLRHAASTGYSTCICYNVLNGKIIYDKNAVYQNLLEEFSFTYPEKLQSNIIEKNRNLLEGKIPSYFDQIKKAVYREDYVSINHRISAFLESYFDIIFAINKKYHPGEKRLIEQARASCLKLPENWEKDIIELLNCKNIQLIIPTIQHMVENVDTLIENLHKINFLT